MKKNSKISLLVAAMLPCAGSAFAVNWDETTDGGGDAGSLVPGAQVASGSGALTSISGALFDNNDVDLYQIDITDPANFSASTVGMTASSNSGVLDTQLTLFDATGVGIVHNDDIAVGNVESALNTPVAGLVTPGLYLLAISSWNNDPIGPAFPGGPEGTQEQPTSNAPLSGWDNRGTDSGTYTINLTGASLVTPGGGGGGGGNPVPDTGTTIALLGLAFLGLAGFKKRTRKQ